MNLNSTLRNEIEKNLAKFDYTANNDENLRCAAVAIVITGSEANPSVPGILLTLRPIQLNQHSGQYALPGGKLDPGETPNYAAIRELEEELGIKLSEDHLVGRLDDYATRSGFCISPIILWVGKVHEIIPAPAEVEAVFHIPFSELDSEAIPVFEPGVDPDRPVLCSEFPTLGHRMYSPTASIIYQFREVAIRGNSTRVAHYDQPQFAWQ